MMGEEGFGGYVPWGASGWNPREMVRVWIQTRLRGGRVVSTGCWALWWESSDGVGRTQGTLLPHPLT